jgi:hypothetical protein
VRAQRSDTTYTAYSNVVSLDQDLFAGDVVQRVFINFGNSTRPGPVVGWNTLLPSGDQPDAGEEFTGMKDVLDADTGIGVRIIGSFAGVRSSGGRASEDYPLDVIRTSWRLDATTKAEIEFFGLDPAYLYTFKFLSSFQNLGPYWYTGFVSGDRSAYVPANDPVLSSNDSKTADLYSMRPSVSGTIRVKIKALPSAVIGFMNTVKIYKLNLNNAIPVDLTTFLPVLFEPVSYRSGTTNGVMQINLTGAVDSGLDDWNDVNASTSVTFANMITEALVNTGIGIRFVGIDNNRTDNDTNYTGTDEFPTVVIRYGIYRSGNPPPQVFLTNIKETKRLDFRILASRRDTDNIQAITIGSITQEVNVSNNKTSILEFMNVEPDSEGEIGITITYISGPSLGYTYLTAMRVEVKDADANVPVILPVTTFDAVFFDPQVLQNNIIFGLTTFDPVFFQPVVAEAGGSAAVLSTNQFYNGAERAVIYQPAGYNSNSNTYPLIIYLAGAGPVGSGTTVNSILNEGIPLMINQGDTLDGEFLVIAPHSAGLSSWGIVVNGQMRPKHAYDYMVANYRVDTTRVYVTGLSLGSAGSYLFAAAYPALVAGVFAVSGSQPTGYSYASIRNIAVFSIHGSTDSTQDRANTPQMAFAMNSLSPAPKYPPIMMIIWGVGHSGVVWHDNAYRRKNSPVSGTKAKYNYNWWFLKFSKDAQKEAFGFVQYAERTQLIEDYLQALPVVNALPSSSFKTGLLGQLAALKASLYARMFIVDLGSSTYPSASPINNLTNINNGQAVNNLVEYDGAASTVGLTIINRFSTFNPQTEHSVRMAANYFGLGVNFNRDGARMLTSITNGSMKFTGLNNAKSYKVVVYVGMDNGDDFATRAEASVTIGASTQTMYAQYSVFQGIIFETVTPTAGEITIAARASQTRDACITGLILIEKP